MSNRYLAFAIGEHYHVFNHAVENRNLFSDKEDLERFIASMKAFNTVDPIGSMFELERSKEDVSVGGPTVNREKLVEFVCYALNPNHFHFLLRQTAENGISEFMKRLGGYSWYFNNKHKRIGSLFRGRFKAIHVGTNEYLLHLSAYINLNWKVHGLQKVNGSLIRSSWEEYIDSFAEQEKICSNDIILTQFQSLRQNSYKNFAESTVAGAIKRREQDKVFEKMLLE